MSEPVNERGEPLGAPSELLGPLASMGGEPVDEYGREPSPYREVTEKMGEMKFEGTMLSGGVGSIVALLLLGGFKLGDTWKRYAKNTLYSWGAVKGLFNMVKGAAKAAGSL